MRRLLALRSRANRIRIYEWANVGNHLHLLIQAKTRDGFKSFLRSLTGTIAMRVTGARKGSALRARFWDRPVFTRIVEWGRAFRAAQRYVALNRLEATGDWERETLGDFATGNHEPYR